MRISKRKTIKLRPKILPLLFLFFSLISYVDLDAFTLFEVEEGVPEPGKQVKVYLDDSKKIYYILFLPYNFIDIKRFGVICEIPYAGMHGSVLGYGISQGLDYILVTLPVLNTEGDGMLNYYYPDNPQPTANYWLEVLKDLNRRFSIDNNKIILSGFSRGSICVNYIGNCNHIISSKWAAYFCYAHFDGCCQIVPGNLVERINRIRGKKVLIAIGKNDLTHKCSKEAYSKLKARGIQVTFIEHDDIYSNMWPDRAHNPLWIVEDSDAANAARSWLKKIFSSR